MNYYELFDLPVAPMVDKSLLAKKYFELQRKNHPDFFTQSGEDEKENALKQSADINKAFGIFKNEERTLEYFLKLKGIITDSEKYNLPPEFLMEMMEFNESFSASEADKTKQKIAEYENSIYKEVQPIIERYDAENIQQEALLKLKEYFFKKKYINRILDRLVD